MISIKRAQPALAVALAIMWLTGIAAAGPWSEEYEERIGEQAIAEVEKEYTVYEDEEASQRVAQIVAAIVPHTQRLDVEYDIRLLDSDEVNSFSAPGGHIFVTKGLFAEVQSDAELAAVMAHEIAHNCTYDALNQLKRAKNLSLATAAAAVAVIVLGRGEEMVYGALYAGQIATRGILSKYSIEIETQADRNALQYLLATDYNSVGLLTFMERLAQKQRRRPGPELGIFQTHPHADQRVRAILHQLLDAEVEINRRAVTQWDPPSLEETESNGHTAWSVALWGQPVFTYDQALGCESPQARGERIVEVLAGLLADGVEAFEFRVTEAEGHPAVAARGRIVLTVYPEDAILQEITPQQKAEATYQSLRRALYTEKINRLY